MWMKYFQLTSYFYTDYVLSLIYGIIVKHKLLPSLNAASGNIRENDANFVNLPWDSDTLQN